MPGEAVSIRNDIKLLRRRMKFNWRSTIEPQADCPPL